MAFLLRIPTRLNKLCSWPLLKLCGGYTLPMYWVLLVVWDKLLSHSWCPADDMSCCQEFNEMLSFLIIYNQTFNICQWPSYAEISTRLKWLCSWQDWNGCVHDFCWNLGGSYALLRNWAPLITLNCNVSFLEGIVKMQYTFLCYFFLVQMTDPVKEIKNLISLLFIGAV